MPPWLEEGWFSSPLDGSKTKPKGKPEMQVVGTEDRAGLSTATAPRLLSLPRVSGEDAHGDEGIRARDAHVMSWGALRAQ